MDLKDSVRSIKDFPKKGIIFRDVTTLFKDPEAFHQLMDELAAALADKNVDVVVGPEARGFAMGAPLAYLMRGSMRDKMHPETLALLTRFLTQLRDEGEDAMFASLRAWVKENGK